jgi:hypothetical protein
MQTKNEIKDLAKKVQKVSKELGYEMKLGHAIEIVSKTNFNQEWNILSSKIKKNEELINNYKEKVESLQSALISEMNKGKVFTSQELKRDNIVKSEITKLFIKMIESNDLKYQFNLGFLTESKKFLIKDFTKEPNLLLVGAMGTGKSIAAKSIIYDWMIRNGENTTLFIVDYLKGANQYKDIFKYDQVYPILHQKEIHRMIDLIYSEAMSRVNLLKEQNVFSINEYEKNNNTKISRIICLIEQFHAIPYHILDFDKNYNIEGTSAYKLHQLMRIGRPLGIWFIATSPRSTKSDIPHQLVPNFYNKAISKVSKAESYYILGNDNPSKITADQKGVFFTDFGKIQFPFIKDEDFKIIIDKYLKNKNPKNIFLNPDLIKECLEGKETKKIYENRKLSDLAKNFHNLNGKLVVSILHNKLKSKIIKELNEDSLSHIIELENKKQAVIMIKNKKRLHAKHITQLIAYIKEHNYDKGIIYTNNDTPSQSLYNLAVSNNIEIIDQEDLINISFKLE